MKLEEKIKNIDLEIDKITSDVLLMKLHINSSYGMNGRITDYTDLIVEYNKSKEKLKDYNQQKYNLYKMLDRKQKIEKICKRVSK